MSFKKLEIYPPNPSTNRGTSTKLSSSKDKVIYTSGRTVVVRNFSQSLETQYILSLSCAISRFLLLLVLMIGHRITGSNPLESCPQHSVLGPHPERHGRANLSVWVLLRICGCYWERCGANNFVDLFSVIILP